MLDFATRPAPLILRALNHLVFWLPCLSVPYLRLSVWALLLLLLLSLHTEPPVAGDVAARENKGRVLLILFGWIC